MRPCRLAAEEWRAAAAAGGGRWRPRSAPHRSLDPGFGLILLHDDAQLFAHLDDSAGAGAGAVGTG